MKKIISILKTTLLFMPALIIVCLVNTILDSASIYHDFSEDIAKKIIEGNDVYMVSHPDERKVKYELIKNMPDKVECVAIGPSLIMGIRKIDVGTESFFNLGESSADFYDVLAQFGMMKYYKKNVDRVIICIFHGNFYESNYTDRHEQYKQFAEYMINLLYGNELKTPHIRKQIDLKNKVSQLFSMSYFQSALHILKNREINSYWGIVENPENYDGYYYKSDGSWVYAKEYQNSDLNFLLKDTETLPIESIYPNSGSKISEYNKQTFEMLIEYLLKNSVDVELFLCSCAPCFWDRIQKTPEKYTSINELENYAHLLAGKYNLKITGSYNPYAVGMKNEDFYDARHVRHEKLSTYYDFK